MLALPLVQRVMNRLRASLCGFVLCSSKTANVWEAELASGATGVPDTADWVTTNAGYNLVGSVDFNADHLGDGSLMLSNLSVAAAGTYPLALRYSNGTGSAQAMQLTVNSVVVVPSFNWMSSGVWPPTVTVTFPKSAPAKPWAPVVVTLYLPGGKKVMR